MVTDTSPCVAQACAGGYGGGAVFVTADPINRISFSIHNSTFENNSAPVRPMCVCARLLCGGTAGVHGGGRECAASAWPTSVSSCV